MAGEAAALVADTTPYVTAAVSAYGGAVLAKVRDDAASTTAEIGRRLLQRVFGHRKKGEPLPTALADLSANPADTDAAAVVRWAIERALETDATMLEDIRTMLASAQTGGVKQNVRAGRDTYVAGRDMTINRTGR